MSVEVIDPKSGIRKKIVAFNCPECNKEIEIVCPHCGQKISPKKLLENATVMSEHEVIKQK